MTHRHVRAALLLGSALLIAKLFFAGEMVKYMNPALDPLTALTGVLLAVMGAMELRGSRTSEDADHGHGRASDRLEQTLTNLLLLVPLALGFLIVPRALGSSALGGESVTNLLLTFGTGPAPAARSPSSPPPPPAKPIEDIPDLMTYLRQAGELGVGQQVRVTGLVARSEALRPEEFALLRYSIAHCVADARPLGLLVVTGGDVSWSTDQWVQIDGTLESHEREGDRLVTIAANSITAIEEPNNPYLRASY
jgi:putative membrane protein